MRCALRIVVLERVLLDLITAALQTLGFGGVGRSGVDYDDGRNSRESAPAARSI